MALADYKCDKCGDIREADEARDVVPLCCGDIMRRLFSTPGIAFKGSGFYVNDYKNKGNA